MQYTHYNKDYSESKLNNKVHISYAKSTSFRHLHILFISFIKVMIRMERGKLDDRAYSCDRRLRSLRLSARENL